jgi:hypothetical protein
VEANLRCAVYELIEKLKNPICSTGKWRLPFMDKSGTLIDRFKTQTMTRRSGNCPLWRNQETGENN